MSTINLMRAITNSCATATEKHTHNTAFQMLFVSLILLLSQPTHAQYATVGINEVAVYSEIFIVYQKFAEPAKRHYYPKTDEYVVKSVVEQSLMNKATNAAGYKATDIPGSQQKPNYSLIVNCQHDAMNTNASIHEAINS